MFTGIITHTGVVTSSERLAGLTRFRVDSPDLGDRLRPGDSVAVSGVCLTATSVDETGFEIDAVETTLSRTTLARWAVGTEVNLECALGAGEPLGGHLVQGHIDDVAEVVEVGSTGGMNRLTVRLVDGVRRVTVDRGSLAIDGVSLTVAGLSADIAEFAIIPYTWSHTTLRRLEPGARVNVEADLIGKYVDRLVQPYRESNVAPETPGDGPHSQTDTDRIPHE